MNKREFDALQKRVTVMERAAKTNRGTVQSLASENARARVNGEALQAALIKAAVLTRDEIDAAKADQAQPVEPASVTPAP